MGLRSKTITIILLLSVFMSLCSGRLMKSFEGGDSADAHIEVIHGMKIRNLIDVDAIMDYGKPGPNPRHDQGKGKPGGGSGIGGPN